MFNFKFSKNNRKEKTKIKEKKIIKLESTSDGGHNLTPHSFEWVIITGALSQGFGCVLVISVLE